MLEMETLLPKYFTVERDLGLIDYLLLLFNLPNKLK